MSTFFESHRESVTAFLDEFLTSRQRRLERVNRWGREAIDILRPFLRRGKMIRGGLVTLGFRTAGGRDSQIALPAAAAAELMQAALLVHDDIMDHDPVRRGAAAVHEQFADQGRKAAIADPTRFGDGMGICFGDMLFFLTFELLTEIKTTPGRLREVWGLWSRELSRVALAQMQDVFLGMSGASLSEEEILDLYLSKTARYTFSLPMVTGAHLAGADPLTLGKLEECGEKMGLLFQMRDDDLGLFGSEEALGKPVGSDIRENKKTLHYLYLFQSLGESERERLRGFFGSKDLAADHVEEIRGRLETTGARSRVREKMTGYHDEARRLIVDLGGDPEARSLLLELLDYITARDS